MARFGDYVRSEVQDFKCGGLLRKTPGSLGSMSTGIATRVIWTPTFLDS
jgi:hypothetical protein